MQPKATRAGVAFLLGRLDFGGAELRAIEIAEFFDSSFDFVSVLGGHQNSVLSERLHDIGARLHVVSQTLHGMWRFARLLRANGISVVHSAVGVASGPWILVAAVAGVKTRIVHYHSEGLGGTDSRLRRLKIYLSTLLIRGLSTHVIFASPSVQAFVSQFVPGLANKGVVIPNPVDVDGLNAQEGKNHWSPEDAVEGPVIAHVGRLVPSKNRDRAVRVASAVQRRIGGMLVLVGPVTAGELELARELGVRFVHLEQVVQMGRLLRHVDVLLVTSTREGLPGVVLEALAVGTPVVASDIPSISSLSASLPGIHLCQLGEDDDAWVDGVAQVLVSNDPAELKRSLRESDFSLEQACARYGELWDIPGMAGRHADISGTASGSS